MRTVMFLAIIAACVQTPASASQWPYCMDVGLGGGTRTDCTYASRAQCLASKVDNSSTCYPNPRWVPGRKRR